MILGIDTSNYTTSISLVDDKSNIIFDERILLSVKKNMRGLRQSEAFYQHVNNLPVLFERIPSKTLKTITAICVSTRPRNVEGSYMPCFKAGISFARVISSILDVSLFETSHQEGHIMAGLHNNSINSDEFISVHLSGGTTEILGVELQGSEFVSEIYGGSIDISAGQFIDRVGVMMGFDFPCGKQMDSLVLENIDMERYELPVSVKNYDICFSGVETKCNNIYRNDNNQQKMTISVFYNVAKSLSKAINNIYKDKKIENVLFVGGVASSVYIKNLLRQLITPNVKLHFADAVLASDNAVGVAMIGNMKVRVENEK